VYGHDTVKNEIIQVISQWITNPDSKGNVLALQGPMGNGKTTLAKNGLAKVLKRPFALIALGGAKDSSFLNGHEYTYEGSKCGRIVEVLRDLQCMNPVIFFDELDKLSDTPNGQEISNLLCHITDPVQNTGFHDRYFSGIDFDLSKAIFVMSFNDESKINTILKDRMHVVRMKGFKAPDKIKIARQYLIPEICDELNFDTEMVKISDEVLKYIIDTHTKEEGCRSFRRCLKTIYSKLNVLNLLSETDEKAIQEVITFKLESVTFPMTLTLESVRALLNFNESSDKTSVQMMYM
jgi:ATP-dependent Lon protease